MADDPRFARQRIVVDTDGTAGTKQLTAALEPAKVITGRVTYADTGQPVPHATLGIIDYREHVAYSDEFETDAEGRFRAMAPIGQPLQCQRRCPRGTALSECHDGVP